jgi:rSAM/selenodomain-associated transferase 1
MALSKLLIFAKAPIAGHAKSRMIPLLGAEGAAQLHQLITRWMLQQLNGRGDYVTELWCASDIEHPFFQRCAREFDIKLQLQQGADLGERQHHAIISALYESDHVVVIGSDVLSLTVADIQYAFNVLEQGVGVVLSPAEDGGYGLIGASTIDDGLFKKVPWGSDQVYAAMVNRLQQLGIDWQPLSQVWDLDRPEDLLRLAVYPQLAEEVAALVDNNAGQAAPL